MQKKEELLEQSLKNIAADRHKAEELFKKTYEEITKTPLQMGKVGTVAAKAIDALQRSNEQLIRIYAEIAKQENEDDDDEGVDLSLFGPQDGEEEGS